MLILNLVIIIIFLLCGSLHGLAFRATAADQKSAGKIQERAEYQQE